MLLLMLSLLYFTSAFVASHALIWNRYQTSPAVVRPPFNTPRTCSISTKSTQDDIDSNNDHDEEGHRTSAGNIGNEKLVGSGEGQRRQTESAISTTGGAYDDNDTDGFEELGEQETDFKSGFVSILGNPNAGKSTLMNRLLGEDLCITSPKPQTTRHRILGVLTEEEPTSHRSGGEDEAQQLGGYQLVFSDTPGMLNPAYKLQETMQEAVRGAAGDADVVLLVTDMNGEALQDESVMEKLTVTDRPIVVVINKMDLANDYSDWKNEINNQPVSIKGSGSSSSSRSDSISSSSSGDVNKETESKGKASSLKQRIFRNRNKGKTETPPPTVAATVTTKSKQQATAVDASQATIGSQDQLHPSGSSGSDSSSTGSNITHKDTENGNRDDPAVNRIDRVFEDYAKLTGQENVNSGEQQNQQNQQNKQSKQQQQQQQQQSASNPERSIMHPTFTDLELLWKSRLPAAEIIGVSARDNVGVERLLKTLVGYLPQGPKYFPADTLTNRNERFFTAEIIRECIFSSYRDEIPYSCEVVIDSFKDKRENLSVIECGIIVNRNSQKGILIGKHGSKLKELGTLARQKLEKFLDRRVFLTVRVRVDPDWRVNEDSLARYGYIDSDFA